MSASHRVDLGPGWSVWRDVVLRSAGFPAGGVAALGDRRLADAADAALRDPSCAPAYRAEYADAGARLSAAVRELAGSPRFREAVTWQNPKIVALCLDKLVTGEPRNVRGRNHELAVASYAQRYCLKNDTIGFVGPVGWARWTESGDALALRPGNSLLRRRTVYFEIWAIDAVARTLSADPLIRPWLVPRLFGAHRLDGAVLHQPGRAVALSPAEAEVLSYVDGVRSLAEIADELAWSEFPELGERAELLTLMDAMVEAGLVRHDLVGAIDAWPERALLARIDRIADETARRRAREVTERIIAARDRVGVAAGDDVALADAMAGLDQTFREITGLDGERRAGQTYAGRTLVYEDTVRDATVELGPDLRADLAAPLRLLLDSARWLVAEIGDEYDRVFADIHDRRAGQSGSDAVPISAIMSLATPHLYYNVRALSKPARRAVDEFQSRWAQILRISADGREVRLRSEDIAQAVAELFPVRRAPWATAIYHSPDFMLAAESAEAVRRGDYLLVLGELHLSFNTMESRLFVQQHEDPGSLLAAAEADLGDNRIYGIPPRDVPTVTSRVAPPSALLSPHYTYWTFNPESIEAPGPVIPCVDLTVHREGDGLVVRSRTGELTAPLPAVVGEPLSSSAINAFKPVTSARHSPRIVLDKLVIARETWSFPAAEVAWAACKREDERFLRAREWRTANGLPERAFYKVPVEDKPTYVDFTSLVYVNLLAKSIRRSAEQDGGSVTLTEMLPDHRQLWLRDAHGEAYTSELRICVVDTAVHPGGARSSW